MPLDTAGEAGRLEAIAAQHTRWELSHRVSYWKGGVASTPLDADSACVEVRGMMGSHIRLEFAMPGEKDAIAIVEEALLRAHEIGYRKAKKDLRDFLEVKEK